MKILSLHNNQKPKGTLLVCATLITLLTFKNNVHNSNLLLILRCTASELLKALKQIFMESNVYNHAT